MADNQYTFENEVFRNTYRHTTSHILAQAVKRLYPDTKLAIGPAIADGFYYDFDTDRPFTPEDLEALEAEMRKICKEKLPLERFELPGRRPSPSWRSGTSPIRSSLSGTCRGRGHQLLQAGRVHRSLRRSPSGQHRPGQGQRHQADKLHRRLLARRLQQQDASAHLRHQLPEEG